MKKTYQIQLMTNNESNEYLRCLWSRIRFHFGKLAWNLYPHKIGKTKTIFFGDADMGKVTNKFDSVSFSCNYSKKGCLKTLTYECSNLKDPHQFEEMLDTCINESFSYRNYLKIHLLEFKLGTEILFNPFNGKNFSLKDNILRFKICGYDKADISTFSQNIVRTIKNLLSFDTLRFIHSKGSGIEQICNIDAIKCSFTSSNNGDLISEINTNDRYKNLSISKYIADYVDILLDRNIDYECLYTKFEESISIFSQGLFFEEMNNSKFYLDTTFSEYAVLCYMSALEVISCNDITSSKCDKCGQDVYSISKRVTTLVKNATNNDFFKNTVSDFYKARSKFVHTGKLLSMHNYIGESIPLLSINSKYGIVTQHSHLGFNIKELIKECIIWHKNNVILEK